MGAIRLNRVLSAAIFVKNTILFHWQQYQYKMEGENNVSITWEEFKTFFCQGLGKLKAFVDTI